MRFSGRILVSLFVYLNLAGAHSVRAADLEDVGGREVAEGRPVIAKRSEAVVSRGYDSLESLYEGNRRFRNVAGKREVAVSQLVQERESLPSPLIFWAGQ